MTPMTFTPIPKFRPSHSQTSISRSVRGTPRTMNIYPLAFGLASYLANSGRKKGSLSNSGALGAWIIGYLTMASDLRLFGALMIVFYLLGSKATKYKSLVKAQLEQGHQASSTTTPSAGHRTFFQVLSNSFSGTLAAILWRVLYGSDGVHYGGSFIDLRTRCPVVPTSEDDRWSKVLIFAAVGHFACCLGDTLASELGILSKTRPRLITTFRQVPPGTNGGISPFGLAVSLLGGLIVSSTATVLLALESPACRSSSFSPFASGSGSASGSASGRWATGLAWAGVVGGLGGSALDSVLGATVQRTVYSTRTNKVLVGDSAGAGAGALRRRTTTTKGGKGEKNGGKEEEDGLVVVAGWDVLTNSQINLLSSAACALFCGYLAL